MTDMCLRIDGLPQATKGYTLLPFQGVFAAINLPRVLPWAMGCCPFGACFQMHVYDNHLEIWNEGELPLGYTEETLMGRHSSKPRNRNIANTMFKAGFIDTWGRGYMKIRDGFEAAGIPMPKVQNFCGGVEVTVQRTTFIKMMNVADKTVPNTKYLADTPTSTPTSIEQVQTETNQFITDNENIKRLVLVVGEMNLSVSEMMEGTGLKDRKNFLEYSLNPAISDGWVRMLYPDSPRHPRQKYLLTLKGKGLFNRLNGSSWGTGTDTSDSQE